MTGFLIFITLFFLVPWGLATIVQACIEESVRRHDAAARQRDRERENRLQSNINRLDNSDPNWGR
jgi:hypothetical protein